MSKGNYISFCSKRAFNILDETLKFRGDDAEKSNVLIAYALLQEKYLTNDLFDKNPKAFQNAFRALEKDFQNLNNFYL